MPWKPNCARECNINGLFVGNQPSLDDLQWNILLTWRYPLGTPKWMVYNGKFLLKWMIQRYPHGLETSMCSPEIANGFTNPGPSQAQGHRPPSLLRVIQALSHCIPISANRNCIKISRGKYSVFQ